MTSALRRSLAGGSRFAASEHQTAEPLTRPEQFAEDLRQLVRSTGSGLLLPVAEPALLALLPRRDSIPAILPFPAFDAFRSISDKAHLLEVAADLDIATPRQIVLPDRDSASLVRSPGLGFPVVLKPSRSVGESARGRFKVGVRHAATVAELERVLVNFPPEAFPVLAQQRILGAGVGVFLLRWKGRLVAACAHQRIREKPPSGGVSVYRASVPLEPVLRDKSLALLQRFDWEGVAMVEYKREATTGTPYLMEVNGRFWGSLQLAIDAGVDFPRLLVELALGREVEPVLEGRPGVRSRWWWGEVDHLLARLGRSDEELALPPGSPSRWRALRDFLWTGYPDDRAEILRLEDPGPAWRETLDWFRGR